MTIQHHPSEPLLTAFAAGNLDQGQHVAVATHLVRCAACRGWVRSVEQVAGAVLADLPPAVMSAEALRRVESRLDAPVKIAKPVVPMAAPLADMPGLPAFARSLPAGRWHWLAPGLHLKPIRLPYEESTRVFLLRSAPGAQLMEHTHTGAEMTCVLTGRYSHAGGDYGPGDFDLGDDTVDHRIHIGPEADCICLVAMSGRLELKGWIGRLMQPFVGM